MVEEISMSADMPGLLSSDLKLSCVNLLGCHGTGNGFADGEAIMLSLRILISGLLVLKMLSVI